MSFYSERCYNLIKQMFGWAYASTENRRGHRCGRHFQGRED